MIDEKSLTILKILQEKARIPNTEVARQVNLAPSAVLERIRKMENQGVIQGYEVRLNPEQFTKNLVAFVTITCSNCSQTTPNIAKSLANITEIQEVHFIAGEDGYFVKLRVADTKELNTILREEISNIDGVVSTKTLTVLETFKETAKFSI